MLASVAFGVPMLFILALFAVGAWWLAVPFYLFCMLWWMFVTPAVERWSARQAEKAKDWD